MGRSPADENIPTNLTALCVTGRTGRADPVTAIALSFLATAGVDLAAS